MSESGQAPLEIELVAPPGAGKRTLAQQFCAQLHRDMIAVDAKVLLGAEAPLALATERAIRVLRLAKLSQALVYWYAAEGVDPRVWRSVAEYAELTLVGTEAPRPGLASGAPRQVLRLPALSRALRYTVWQHYTNQPLPEVVTDWSLTPAEIEYAARTAPA